MNVTVNFQIEAACTQWGQTLAIVGDIAQLGNWTLCQQLKLEPNPFPVWTTSVSLPPSTRIQYKYVIVHENNTAIACWETFDSNRVLTTATAGMTMNVDDGQFNHCRQHTTQCVDNVDGKDANDAADDAADEENTVNSSPRSIASIPLQQSEEEGEEHFSLLANNSKPVQVQGDDNLSVSLSSSELSSTDDLTLYVPSEQEELRTMTVCSALNEARQIVDELRFIVSTWHTKTRMMRTEGGIEIELKPNCVSKSVHVSLVSKSVDQDGGDASAIDAMLKDLVSGVNEVLKDVVSLRSSLSSGHTQTMVITSCCSDEDDGGVSAESKSEGGGCGWIYVSSLSMVCFVLCALVTVLQPYVGIDANAVSIRGGYLRHMSLSALKRQAIRYFS